MSDPSDWGYKKEGYAAEALVLARYFMFTQVYFHKTRVSLRHSHSRSDANIVPGGRLPRTYWRRNRRIP